MNLTRTSIIHYLAVAILVVMLTPDMAQAEAPASVTGLKAKVQGQEIALTWDALKDSSITGYIIYYSSESIIQNAGLYDDFEAASGSQSIFLLRVPYRSGKVYIGILAVNADGEESLYFHDEVEVDLIPAAPAITVAVPASSPAPVVPPGYTTTPPRTFASDGTMHLLGAEVLSPTQIVLTFSNPIVITAETAPQAFRIADPQGKPLAIRSMIVDLEKATVETETMQRGTVYQVQISEPLTGKPSLPLDALDRSAFFTGHQEGSLQAPASPFGLQPPQASYEQQPPQAPFGQGLPVGQPTQPAQPAYPGMPPGPGLGVQPQPLAQQQHSCPRDPTNPPGVANFTLTPALQETGLYTVTARWQVDNRCDDLIGLMVLQTRDRGRSFGEPSLIPINVAGVKLSGVNPGEFGLVIYTINVYRYTARGGAFQNVQLPFYGGYNPVTYPFRGEIIMEYITEEEKIELEIIEDATPESFPVTIVEPEEVPVEELRPAAPFPGTTIDPVRLAIVLVSGFAIIVALVFVTVSVRKKMQKIAG